MVLRKGIRKIKQGMKKYNNQLSVLRIELRNCKKKAQEQSKQIQEQQKLISEQQKQMDTRLDENDKKNDEMSRKFSTVLQASTNSDLEMNYGRFIIQLFQELNKCKTELQYWRSKSPHTLFGASVNDSNNSSPIGDMPFLSSLASEDPTTVIAQIEEPPAQPEVAVEVSEGCMGSSKRKADTPIEMQAASPNVVESSESGGSSAVTHKKRRAKGLKLTPYGYEEYSSIVAAAEAHVRKTAIKMEQVLH